MTGALYTLSYDGKVVTPYLDINAPAWNVSVQSNGSERGVQSFAFHPQFNQRGTPGYGKFYTYTDTSNVTPKPDFVTPGPNRTHDTVLLEWTAKNAGGRHLRRRRAARAVSRRAAVRQSQRRADRLQPVGRSRAAPTSGCCMSASATAATAATRSTSRRT